MLLVGIGWNFAFIGSTTLLSTVYTNSEKFKVQATNDTVVFASSAIAVLVKLIIFFNENLEKQVRWAFL